MSLIVISNRLPLTIKDRDGRLEFTGSAGGLATGLQAYLHRGGPDKATERTWVGWPGGDFPPERHDEIRRRLREEFSGFPVFLSVDDTEKFYEGFCNNTLWPLFHYFPTLASYDEQAWASYERVNRIFCDAVLPLVQADDLIWVQDYHFMLLPRLLKERQPHLRIGFFLHIPFPSYELFRLLPSRWRTALLEGLLGADLVGFHTHDYTQHFLKSVRRILGYDHHMGEIALRQRVVKADTFPMGIDFDAFAAGAAEPAVARIRDELRRPLGDSRVILSIDRLDYTKGIDKRLLAYQAFLKANPTWRGRVVLLLVVVPSRIGVEEYRRMKSRIDKLVGEINGRFGTLTWTPVVYQYRNFGHDTLEALYSAADVMLVTPLRDGMNLVAKEYLACRTDNTGVLVLSEMAGAASELGEALLINPNDVSGMAEALREALEMPRAAQERDIAAMRLRLRRYNVMRWAEDFLDSLQEARQFDQELLTPGDRQRIIDAFQTAQRRLLLLDYDGTLVPIRRMPYEAAPGPEIRDLLLRLGRLAEVIVISGRDRGTLDRWFSGVPIGFIAEHGVWTREPGGAWTVREGLSADWKPKVREIMELYVDRLPGALIEEKELSIAWHFRRADPDLAALRVHELTDHLIALTENTPASILEGHKVVEVRPAGITKGIAVQTLLGRGHDFILAAGDDVTDEDIFRALPSSSFSLRVGLVQSGARFNVLEQRDVVGLLESLAVQIVGQPTSGGAHVA